MTKKKLLKTLRRIRRRNRLGVGATCAICGTDDVVTLRKVGERILCAECHLDRQGKRPTEKHHVVGRINDEFSIALPANDHAHLSDAQYDWPSETLRNTNANPLIKIAAWLRAITDIKFQLMKNAPVWALKLELINKYMTDRIGQN